MSKNRVLTSDPEPRLPQDMVSGTFPLRSHPHLSAYPVLQRELEGAYTQFAAYANLIAGGGRLAPTLWESLSHYEVERTAARILGAPHPRMLQDNLQRRITWTDVLHEGLTPTDFQRQPNGMYRCRVRGTLIEISKSSYIEILTGVTERLVQPLQTLSDEQEEYRVRLKLAAYLQDTQSTLAQFDYAVRETIQNLNKLSMRDGAESSPTRQTKGPIPTVIAVRPRSTAPKLEKSPVPPNGLQTPVIWISDTEDGNDEIFSADESHNCTGLGRWKSPGTTENNLKEQKCSDIEGFLKVEPSSVPWGYSNESEIENKDGGLSGSDLVQSARGPTRNGINSKSAGSVQTAPKSSVRADSSFDPKAASFGRVQKRVRHWISSQEASSSATEKVKRVKCESSHSVIVAVTSNDTKLPVSNTQNPSPKVIVPCQSSGLNRNIRRESTISEATTELIGSDIDSVSTGSDIPWMTEEKQTYNSSDVTREPWGDTKSPDNAPHGNRDEIRASMIERRGGGPKYSEREKNEGPAFVRSLLDKRCTIAEIETEYLREFMIFRTAAALFRRFDIKGTRWLIDRHRKARRLSEMRG